MEPGINTNLRFQFQIGASRVAPPKQNTPATPCTAGSTPAKADSTAQPVLNDTISENPVLHQSQNSIPPGTPRESEPPPNFPHQAAISAKSQHSPGATSSWTAGIISPNKQRSVTVQLGARPEATEAVQKATPSLIATAINKILYPSMAVGKECALSEERDAGRLLAKIKGEYPSATVAIETIPVGEREIQGLYMRHDPSKARPTVVLFHANGATAIHMKKQAMFYFQQGFDVMAPTMGGYPGTDKVATSEATTYQDVEGVKQFLVKKGVTEAGYHGQSIGGSLAFQAAAGKGGTEGIKPLFVVADQTFTKAQEVMPNVAANYAAMVGAGGLASGLVGIAARSAVPRGEVVSLPGGGKTITDGLDNRDKAEKLRDKGIPVISIGVENDLMMKIGKEGGNLSKLSTPYFEMKSVRTSSDETRPAEHLDSFTENPVVQEKLEAQITSIKTATGIAKDTPVQARSPVETLDFVEAAKNRLGGQGLKVGEPLVVNTEIDAVKASRVMFIRGPATYNEKAWKQVYSNIIDEAIRQASSPDEKTAVSIPIFAATGATFQEIQTNIQSILNEKKDKLPQHLHLQFVFHNTFPGAEPSKLTNSASIAVRPDIVSKMANVLVIPCGQYITGQDTGKVGSSMLETIASLAP